MLRLPITDELEIDMECTLWLPEDEGYAPGPIDETVRVKTFPGAFR